ncbi:hypothetical protein PUV54_10120 [Hyphococcus flavus]|uniref:Uncharacterized protein n=1 Tax=Hyphococcus flavus TaxID=1866326 RepID=A0AAF0CF05_9PROT|nr:hypothetical protein [Hyphococcus flavus]WDI30313.1 hypothetical protein PUV54_10120 [Hyphococcus flavus]
MFVKGFAGFAKHLNGDVFSWALFERLPRKKTGNADFAAGPLGMTVERHEIERALERQRN